MKLLTKEQKELYENTKIRFICNEEFENKYVKHKIIVKLEIISIMQENIEVLRISHIIQNIVYLKQFP